MRVVSLVPSATETLLALGVTPVACTRFCLQPAIEAVGGTKNPDVARVRDLAPDLVVMNDEENRLDDYDAIRAAGLRVHSMSPRTVRDVGPAVADLAESVSVPTPEPFTANSWSEWVDAQHAEIPIRQRSITFVWRRPWMALGRDTYGSSVLDLLGLDNVVVDLIDGDDRYPEVGLEQVREADPAVILLPSEPYVFTAEHAADVATEVPRPWVALVDGQHLFWWGIRTPRAVASLRAAVAPG